MAGLTVGNVGSAKPGYTYNPWTGKYSNAGSGRGAEADASAKVGTSDYLGAIDAYGRPVTSATVGPESARYAQDARMLALGQSGSMAQLDKTLAAQAAQASQAASSRMAEIQAQIAAQQGMATQAQQAEMARLKTQIAATSALSAQESAQQNATEETRYGRAKEQQAVMQQKVDAIAGKFSAQPGADSGTGATTEQDAAADAAAFAQAKDKIGLINRAASDDISSEVISRGIGGSGIEAGLRAGQIDSARGQLGQLARDQATQQRDRAYQVADRDVADRTLRRGQDTNLAGSMAGLLKYTGSY
jgi:hypothetical protein